MRISGTAGGLSAWAAGDKAQALSQMAPTPSLTNSTNEETAFRGKTRSLDTLAFPGSITLKGRLRTCLEYWEN